ncbi:hypothetical protein Rhow_007795 [Rhodococcus wratislaviensis]|uniref:Uncharacterized protein n=1 Tax=Rhodococcus wratislaviensis TaxID=44752 RepID=A0A402CJ52_RHOWR|nr:hypothetical protein Rhow_007795 [Rhodococcus wratislaviensis]
MPTFSADNSHVDQPSHRRPAHPQQIRTMRADKKAFRAA